MHQCAMPLREFNHQSRSFRADSTLFRRGTQILAVSTILASLSIASSTAWAQNEPEEFSELRALIEINATDGDAGFQIMADADGWWELILNDPNGKRLYDVKGTGSIKEQGLTENFFESAEPSCEEVSLDEFLERFPEGDYAFFGKKIDNGKLEGEATLTHELPYAPANLMPDQVGLVDPGNTTISWAPGTDLGNCPPIFVVIEPPDQLFGYQVIVIREDPEPLVEFIVELSPLATSVTVPAEFLDADAFYKYEIVAIGADEDGEKANQTISESFFCTAPIETADCELPD